MITVNRSALSYAADRCAKVSNQKSEIQVASHMLVECADGIAYRATNFRSEVTGKVPAEGGGRFTVNPRDLASALSALSSENVKLSASKTHLEVKGDTKRSFRLATLDPDQFPAALDVGSVKTKLDVSELAELIATVIFAARSDNDRMEQSRVRIVQRGDVLRGVATDGHRLAMRSLNLKKDLDLNIPLDVARLLVSLKSGTVDITSDTRGMSFDVGGDRLASLAPAGDFPPVDEQFSDMLLPNSVTVPVERLLDAVKAVQRVDSQHDLKVSFRAGRIILECSGSDEATDELEAEVKQDYDVWLNGAFVVDALSAITGEVTLGYGSDPLDTFFLQQDGWRCMISPLMPETVRQRKTK